MCLKEHSHTEDSRSEGVLALPLLSVNLALPPARQGEPDTVQKTESSERILWEQHWEQKCQ